MATFYNQPANRNGLVTYFDSNYEYCYTSGSTQWRDMFQPTTPSGSITGSIGYTSGSLYFDGAGANGMDFYANLGSTSVATIEMWAKLYDSSGIVFGWARYDVLKSLGQGLVYNTANAGDGYGFPATSASILQMTGNWKHYVFEMVSGSSYTNNKIYVNGVNQPLAQIIGTPSLAQIQFNNGNGRISGWRVDTSGATQMNLAMFKVYDRALTQDEITNNFNSTRRRFGV